MMADIVDAITRYIASAATLRRDPKPFQICAHAAVERTKPDGTSDTMDDPHAVVRQYPTPAATELQEPRVAAIQVRSIGRLPAQARELAEKIRATLFAENEPKLNFALAGFVAIGVARIGEPGIIGRDEIGRIEVVFNFDLFYRAA